METKAWYTSITIWASLATIILTATQQGLETVIPEWAAKASPILTTVIAILGRFRALGPLTIK